MKVQIRQQAETVRPSNDTSTQESTTNEIDGTIVYGLAKANPQKDSILQDVLKIHQHKCMGSEKGEMIYQEKTF